MAESTDLKSSSNVEKSLYVPTNVSKLLSDTSEAYDCFAGQRFSKVLQAYMVNYAMNISGYYAVYK